MLTAADLELVAAAFGLGAEPVLTGRGARGLQGEIRQVRTSEGHWAVKELFRAPPEEEARVGAALQETAGRAGVTVPDVVRTATGDVLLAIGERRVRVYSWVDLRAPDRSLDAARIGELLAAMHRAAPAAVPPVHPWYTEPVGEPGWLDLLLRLEEAANPLAERLRAGHDDRLALEGLVHVPSRLRMLHLDLWADNLLATADGRLCVIDWDNSGPGDPSHELALVLFEYCLDEPERAALLHRAYVAAGGPGRVRSAEDFGTTVAQLGHILQLQCEAWLAAATGDARRRAQDGIREFVDRPLTRAVVESLLAAVR